MRHATFSEVIEWISKAWASVKTESILLGFRKAGIIANVTDDESDKSDEEEEAALRPPPELAELFISDTEDEEFNGFDDLGCDGKIACEFKTDTIGSPDPCVGTYKYYNTTYNCIQARVSMTCEGSFSTLACGNDVIQIVSADYGRTDVEICSNGQPSSLIENTDCHAPDTLTSVVEGCNEKRSCILEASNAIFTDPCVGTYKYLAVSYFCRPTQTSVTCEGSTAVLACEVGLLKIHIANYGRTDSTTCSLGRPFGQITKTDCFATTSLSEVATRCKDRSNCTVPATNTVFTDPCVGTYKYLSIVYSCVVNDFLFSL
ncbi:rhamnose-binding lectin-like isoform X2 [Pygocentrus nattereri]|uniref:SUEL-type lectin domain-containing protein n=1 Tax=Pygocentrus nattereri TaxID=42514 RepID=A0AAR2LST7_PYGNA|nr:rhamnose-binding lectin-like isoform X2 [Pygocentrus nattereri]